MARLDEDALGALAARALEGLGVPGRDARDSARILVLADLFGIHTHGVSRLESYGERLELGGINARAQCAWSVRQPRSRCSTATTAWARS